MVKVTVKWGSTSYDVECDTSLPAVIFKSQLFSLTGVPVERQKIMGVKNPPLKARNGRGREHSPRGALSLRPAPLILPSLATG